MRVLLDENVPRKLKYRFDAAHDVTTVSDHGNALIDAHSSTPRTKGRVGSPSRPRYGKTARWNTGASARRPYRLASTVKAIPYPRRGMPRLSRHQTGLSRNAVSDA
jgi:hypothetical protein